MMRRTPRFLFALLVAALVTPSLAFTAAAGPDGYGAVTFSKASDKAAKDEKKQDAKAAKDQKKQDAKAAKDEKKACAKKGEGCDAGAEGESELPAHIYSYLVSARYDDGRCDLYILIYFTEPINGDHSFRIRQNGVQVGADVPIYTTPSGSDNYFIHEDDFAASVFDTISVDILHGSTVIWPTEQLCN